MSSLQRSASKASHDKSLKLQHIDFRWSVQAHDEVSRHARDSLHYATRKHLYSLLTS